MDTTQRGSRWSHAAIALWRSPVTKSKVLVSAQLVTCEATGVARHRQWRVLHTHTYTPDLPLVGIGLCILSVSGFAPELDQLEIGIRLDCLPERAHKQSNGTQLKSKKDCFEACHPAAFYLQATQVPPQPPIPSIAGILPPFCLQPSDWLGNSQGHRASPHVAHS